jgi:beta-phosphoglucomutase-like phosphatase (HAD superfamily)
MAEGCLFDFNGTLYFDHDLNERAWRKIFSEITKDRFSFEEEYEKYKSAGNYAFVKHLFELTGTPHTEEDIVQWSEKKEMLYRTMGIQEGRTVLPIGAKAFLDKLKQNHIPMNIATCSVQSNVDFYFQYFGLDRWFDRNVVVYTGENISKGILFEQAAKNIGCDLSECTVFEDSPSAIESVYEAGCQNIIYVNSRKTKDIPVQAWQAIEDYCQL